MIKEPITLLIRKFNPPSWVLHSRHNTIDAAEDTYYGAVRGRGITAWAWWGPNDEADKMLAEAKEAECESGEDRSL